MALGLPKVPLKGPGYWIIAETVREPVRAGRPDWRGNSFGFFVFKCDNLSHLKLPEYQTIRRCPMTPQKNRERQLIPLTFQQHTVRTVLIDGVPWFIARDVSIILDIQNIRQNLQELPDDEKGVYSIYTPGGNQTVQTVNEPGLYRLIFQSRKSEAEQFKAWVFTSVLPQIRQTGFFFPDPAKLDEKQLALFIARYFESRRPNRQAELDAGKCLVLLKSNLRHGEFMPRLVAMDIPHKSALRLMKRFHKHAMKELEKQQELFELPERKPPIPFPHLPFPGRQCFFIRFRNELPMAAY